MADMNLKRLAFKEYYCNPESDTFGLIKQSAKKAGFSESYSMGLMSDSVGNEWVKNIINDYQLLSKAESNIKKAMDIDVRDEKIGDRAIKVSLFVTERLGKQKWSARTELTGKDGEQLFKGLTEEERIKLDKLLNE